MTITARHALVALSGAAVLVALVPAAAAGSGSATTRVSVTPTGQASSGNSFLPVLSRHGRYVAFESDALDLEPNFNMDSSGSDVHVRDRLTGRNSLVSVGVDGQPGDGPSGTPAISEDGRFVAFESGATNLVPPDTNDAFDVFVRDILAGVTRRASVSSQGKQPEPSFHDTPNSFLPALSGDGRYVAFSSFATDLVPGDTNNCCEQEQGLDVFLRDMRAGTTRRMDVGPHGRQADQNAYSPAVSRHGRFVAFTSAATNLVAHDTNETQDVFVRDVRRGMTSRVSVSSRGKQANGYSYGPSLSADGRYVAFTSGASNLVAGDTNRAYDVFVRDLRRGVTKRVSVGPAGRQADDDSSVGSSYLSADGHRIAFMSEASNLLPTKKTVGAEVYLHDLRTRTTRLISTHLPGRTAPVKKCFDGSFGPYGVECTSTSISADGHHVGFDSDAADLVPEGSNGRYHIYVRDDPRDNRVSPPR